MSSKNSVVSGLINTLVEHPEIPGMMIESSASFVDGHAVHGYMCPTKAAELLQQFYSRSSPAELVPDNPPTQPHPTVTFVVLTPHPEIEGFLVESREELRYGGGYVEHGYMSTTRTQQIIAEYHERQRKTQTGNEETGTHHKTAHDKDRALLEEITTCFSDTPNSVALSAAIHLRGKAFTAVQQGNNRDFIRHWKQYKKTITEIAQVADSDTDLQNFLKRHPELLNGVAVSELPSPHTGETTRKGRTQRPLTLENNR